MRTPHPSPIPTCDRLAECDFDQTLPRSVQLFFKLTSGVPVHTKHRGRSGYSSCCEGTEHPNLVRNARVQMQARMRKTCTHYDWVATHPYLHGSHPHLSYNDTAGAMIEPVVSTRRESPMAAACSSMTRTSLLPSPFFRIVGSIAMRRSSPSLSDKRWSPTCISAISGRRRACDGSDNRSNTTTKFVVCIRDMHGHLQLHVQKNRACMCVSGECVCVCACACD